MFKARSGFHSSNPLSNEKSRFRRGRILDQFRITMQPLRGWITPLINELGGNLYNVKPEIGRYDASYGLVLTGNGDGTFNVILPKDSGMRLGHEIRDIAVIRAAGKKIVLVARNNNTLQVFGY